MTLERLPDFGKSETVELSDLSEPQIVNVLMDLVKKGSTLSLPRDPSCAPIPDPIVDASDYNRSL